MLLLVVVVIALGWLAFAIGWFRSTLARGAGFRYSPSSFGPQASGLLAPPRSEHAALLRRQQVLVALVAVAILTLIMTRLWSAMWVLHIAVDLAAIGFVAAWYSRSLNTQAAPQSTLVADVDDVAEHADLSWEYEPLYADDPGVGPLRFHDDTIDGFESEADAGLDTEPVGAHFSLTV